MDKYIGVAGYTLSFDRLTSDVLRDKPLIYKSVILKIAVEEASKGFMICRIGKATKALKN